MNTIIGICRQQPEILLFLALGIGYYVGKLKFKGFSLGATSSVLIVALLLGQLPGLQTISPLLKTVSFSLFVFCIGYSVGPQFFGALKKQGLSYIWIAVVVALTALITALLLGKIFGFSPGTTAGMMAGAMTTSAAIGTAEGAITHLPGLSEAARTAMETDVAIAYGITYVFGTVGGILLFSFLPGILGINLKSEARKLESISSGNDDADKSPELFSWSKQMSMRAFRAENKNIIGNTLGKIEKSFHHTALIESVQRGSETLDCNPDLIVQAGDLLLIGSSSQKTMIAMTEHIGSEQDISGLADIVGEVMDVCVLNKEIAGKTIAQLAEKKDAQGLFLRKITRQGNTVPILAKTVVSRCDILQLVGRRENVERAVKLIGFAERQTDVTDMITVGCGCVFGTLIGLIVVNVAGIPISLGVGGGVLVSGLLFGWLRTLHPTFGQIPSASRWILQNLGLNLFIACVGIGAGGQALAALKTTGISVFIAGALLTIIPLLVGYVFARLTMKMNPVLVFGALSGAKNCTAILLTLEDEAESSTPVLGYAAPYAVANVVLTIWGSLIVNIMHRL